MPARWISARRARWSSSSSAEPVEAVTGLLTALGRLSGVALSSPVYAWVSGLHVLGLALLIGGILLVDLRLMGLNTLPQAAANPLRRVAALGLAMSLATGLLLLSARPGEYLANPVVWAKLLVVAAASLNAAAFSLIGRLPADGEAPSAFARLAGAISLGGWLAALGLGRWIAFT